MGSIRPHSSRRKPVEVWVVRHEEGQDTEVALFWYKKDAEAYLIEVANYGLDDEDVLNKITRIKPALAFLNDDHQSYTLDTLVVHS